MEAESSFTEEIVSSRVENSQEGAICRICFGVPVEKVRCKGPCRNIFCLGCVSDWRRTQKDKCIFACSTPFLVELVNEDNSSFNCPFNPQ